MIFNLFGYEIIIGFRIRKIPGPAQKVADVLEAIQRQCSVLNCLILEMKRNYDEAVDRIDNAHRDSKWFRTIIDNATELQGILKPVAKK